MVGESRPPERLSMTQHGLTLLGLAMLVPALTLAEVPAGGPRAHSNQADRHGRGAERAASAEAQTKAPEPLPPATPVTPADARAAIDAATAYLNALKDGGFGAAPAYLHPQALERFKTLVMPRLDQEQARGTRTLLNATFGRDASFATAKAADPADFMARFVRVVIARDPQAAPRFATLTPLGVVAEGDRLHVLVRLGSAAGEPGAEGRVEVVSLLPDGKTWKVLLDRRLDELGIALGGPVRADARAPSGRAAFQRIEPMPEGVAPLPLGPQGPAGLPPLPPVPETPRAR
jgi:hypothetical protein